MTAYPSASSIYTRDTLTARSRTQATQSEMRRPKRSLTSGMVKGAMVWKVEVSPPQIDTQIGSTIALSTGENWRMKPLLEMIEPFKEPICQY